MRLSPIIVKFQKRFLNSKYVVIVESKQCFQNNLLIKLDSRLPKFNEVLRNS
jgi:hypothetical protein